MRFDRYLWRVTPVGFLTLIVLGAPAHAQEFDARSTEGTIDRVSNTLLAIAAVAGILLVIYIWHTNPHRRVRVATRRRDRKEQMHQAELEDEFVLPSELDDRPVE